MGNNQPLSKTIFKYKQTTPRIAPPQKQEPDNALSDIRATLTTLEKNKLTTDASVATFALFCHYGILDKNGKFKTQGNPTDTQMHAFKKIELITTIPERVSTLEETCATLQQEVATLSKTVATQQEQIRTLLATQQSAHAVPKE